MNDVLKRLVRDVLELNEETPLDETSGVGSVPGWDSLGTLNLATAAEEAFNVEFDLEDIAELHTLADLRASLRKRGVDVVVVPDE